MNTDSVPDEPTEQEAILKEHLREATRLIAKRIKAIMGKLDSNESPQPPITYHENGCLIEKLPNGYMGISTQTDILGGYGWNHAYIPPEKSREHKETRKVYLVREPEEGEMAKRLYKSLGIDTRYELYVGVHTDRLTMPQVEELLKKDPLSAYFLGSYYYFDENGNCGKAIMLPPEIKDTRLVLENLGGYEDGLRYVKSEIEPGEFELVGFALGILEKGAQASQ